ncbi:MAG TPA: HAMP domain-containing sensor histidine kinase [Ktedonobacteraceae bacterium]|nr:HAMP domain-containing sensor histidine kinase [Ktedonobacteraceae bacterium]
MDRTQWLQQAMARLPIHWRLALVSFGLLALLLAALGILISTTEERALLASQASILDNDAHIVYSKQQIARNPLNTSLILSFPAMPGNMASGYINDIQNIVGQNISASLLSFDGTLLASDTQNTGLPLLILNHSLVQHELTTTEPRSYFLVNNKRGQREMVVLEPLAIWDKAAANRHPWQPAGYRKAILQLSMSTAPIDQSMTATHLILILGIFGALSIAAALTLPLINIALRPLIELERVSTHISAGALSQRLKEPPANDEIGRMARAFNSMVARLETAFARQKRFVSDVSHELRTPLTALGGSLEMLLLGADDGDTQAARRLMVGMYNEVERMQRLVADLLALTHLDEGRIKLRLGAVNAHLLVNTVYEQVQGLLQDQQLDANIPPNLPAIYGDSDQLQRVLLNIVENALKFTPPPGHIEISAYSKHTNTVTLAVHDTGIGISQEALPHVFDRFYRADPSRTRASLRVGGNGLGLSIARELIEAHHGTIEMSSVVGQGTTVLIHLPALQTAPEPGIA